MKLTIGKNNILYLGDSFQKWFGDVEVEPKEVKLKTIILPRDMTDKKILEELKPTKITLDEFFGQFEMMDKKEWYLAYIRDKENNLRVVRAFWFGGGWDVDADSVEGPREWDAGRQVFSREVLVPSDTSDDTLTLESLDARLKKIEDYLGSFN